MTSSVALYGKARRAWMSLPRLDVIVYVGADSAIKPTNDDPYEHDPVTISMKGGTRFFFIPLTTYTEEELVALRHLFNAAFDTAIPVARSLDKIAQERMEAGDEQLAPRIFRSKPTLLIRDLTAKLARGTSKKSQPTTRRTDGNEHEGSAYAADRPADV